MNGRQKAFIAGGTLAGLLVLELGLRIAGFGGPLLYRASPAGYEVVPDQHIHRLGHSLTYNADGFRVTDTRTPYAPIRIMTIGDSITYGGSTTSDSDTYPMQFQRKLHTTGHKVSVLNPSAGGWSLPNEYSWLKTHGFHGAQITYLQIGQNDLFQPFESSDILDSHPSFPSHNPLTAIGEVLTRYVAPRLHLAKPAIDPGAKASTAQPVQNDLMLKAVSDIHGLARAARSDLVIVYIRPKQPSDSPETLMAEDALMRLARTHAIPVIEVSPALMAVGAETVFIDNVHPNTKGNTVIADLVAVDADMRLSQLRKAAQ
ncbi:MAG: SGNH/GDSL hydrolase family protein [Asticcacaulis sp.]